MGRRRAEGPICATLCHDMEAILAQALSTRMLTQRRALAQRLGRFGMLSFMRGDTFAERFGMHAFTIQGPAPEISSIDEAKMVFAHCTGLNVKWGVQRLLERPETSDLNLGKDTRQKMKLIWDTYLKDPSMPTRVGSYFTDEELAGLTQLLEMDEKSSTACSAQASRAAYSSATRDDAAGAPAGGKRAQQSAGPVGEAQPRPKRSRKGTPEHAASG